MMENFEKDFCLWGWMSGIVTVFLKDVLCSFLFSVQEEVCVCSKYNYGSECKC